MSDPPEPPLPEPPAMPPVRNADDPSGPRANGRRIVAVVAVVVVVVVAAAGIIAVTSNDDGGSPTGNASARPPGAPGDVQAKAAVCAPPHCRRVTGSVTISWQPPSSSSPIDGFVLTRDGLDIVAQDDLGADATTYVDDHAEFGRSYHYEVSTVGPGGRSEPVKAASVKVPEPPLSASVLDGVYPVKLEVVHAQNMGRMQGIKDPTPGKTRRTSWSFQATCNPSHGACPTTWFGSGRLVPHGVTYEGTFDDATPATCNGGGTAPVHVRMKLRATRAAADGAYWKVAAFEGEYTVTFSCGSFLSTGTLRVTGTS